VQAIVRQRHSTLPTYGLRVLQVCPSSARSQRQRHGAHHVTTFRGIIYIALNSRSVLEKKLFTFHSHRSEESDESAVWEVSMYIS